MGTTERSETPVKVRKIGHVVFNVSDVERSTRFWTEIMGFKVSDVNERGMVFLRNASDHHSIALFPSKEDKGRPEPDQVAFNHCALEVGSVSELFRIRDFLKARGVPILYEGRRGPGCNPGVEFTDPDGFQIEVYASMDQIGWEGASRPAEQWSRAASLEEVLEKPIPGVAYD